MADGGSAAAASANRTAGGYPGPGPVAHASGGAAVAGIDTARFRSVLGRFATGVVAVTAVDPATGRPAGLAANSFTPVSLEPPLVAFCVAHTSSTWPRLRAAERLCVNILGESQLDVCERLARKGGDKFAGIAWTGSPGGAPVIEGAPAWIECEVQDEHAAGDHVIVVARVRHLARPDGGDPLLFYKGGYGRLDR